MTLEERRKVLHIICDLEDCHKRKETYKAFLEEAAARRFVPAENCMEICEAIIAQQSATQERLSAIFVPLYDFATEGLATPTSQALLDTVREERRRLGVQ